MFKKASIVFVIALLPFAVQSSWLDSLSTVVGGHVSDLKSRFIDDQFIEGKVIKTASFREDDRGQDTLHHGSGTAEIIETADETYIQFAKNFSSTPGPDYHVYISQSVNVDNEARFNETTQIELGRLIKGSGASYYKIPANTDFKSVTVWCKEFNEFIMSADFN